VLESVDSCSLKISSSDSDDLQQAVPKVSDDITGVKLPYYFRRCKDANFAFDQPCSTCLRMYVSDSAFLLIFVSFVWKTVILFYHRLSSPESPGGLVERTNIQICICTIY